MPVTSDKDKEAKAIPLDNLKPVFKRLVEEINTRKDAFRSGVCAL